MEFHYKTAETLAKLLDNEFGFGPFKFGLDPIIGLIPGFGDFLSLLLSFYIVWVAKLHKVPSEHIQKMIANIFLDFIIGIIPLVGDFSDFFFKANMKNMELLRQYKTTIVEGEVVE